TSPGWNATRWWCSSSTTRTGTSSPGSPLTPPSTTRRRRPTLRRERASRSGAWSRSNERRTTNHRALVRRGQQVQLPQHHAHRAPRRPGGGGRPVGAVPARSDLRVVRMEQLALRPPEGEGRIRVEGPGAAVPEVRPPLEETVGVSPEHGPADP